MKLLRTLPKRRLLGVGIRSCGAVVMIRAGEGARDR
jgi:hypothetical protein